MIDNHPIELEALELFRKGEGEKANQKQDEFIRVIKESGEDHCSCTVKCKYHGNCVDCVAIHRGHGHHLPNCFHDMCNKQFKGVSQLTEHTFKP